MTTPEFTLQAEAFLQPCDAVAMSTPILQKAEDPKCWSSSRDIFVRIRAGSMREHPVQDSARKNPQVPGGSPWDARASPANLLHGECE